MAVFELKNKNNQDDPFNVNGDELENLIQPQQKVAQQQDDPFNVSGDELETMITAAPTKQPLLSSNNEQKKQPIIPTIQPNNIQDLANRIQEDENISLAEKTGNKQYEDYLYNAVKSGVRTIPNLGASVIGGAGNILRNSTQSSIDEADKYMPNNPNVAASGIKQDVVSKALTNIGNSLISVEDMIKKGVSYILPQDVPAKDYGGLERFVDKEYYKDPNAFASDIGEVAALLATGKIATSALGYMADAGAITTGAIAQKLTKPVFEALSNVKGPIGKAAQWLNSTNRYVNVGGGAYSVTNATNIAMNASAGSIVASPFALAMAENDRTQALQSGATDNQANQIFNNSLENYGAILPFAGAIGGTLLSNNNVPLIVDVGVPAVTFGTISVKNYTEGEQIKGKDMPNWKNPMEWNDEQLDVFNKSLADGGAIGFAAHISKIAFGDDRGTNQKGDGEPIDPKLLTGKEPETAVEQRSIETAQNIKNGGKENGISLQQLQNAETEKPQQVELSQNEQTIQRSNNGQETQVKTILENAPADKVKYYAVDENGETVSIPKDFFDVQLANAEDVKSADNAPEGQVVYEFTNRGNKYFATIDMTQPTKQPTGQPTEQPQEQPVVEPTGQVNTDTMAGAEPTNVDNTQQRVDYWQDAHSSPIDNPTFGRMTTESGNTVAVRYGFTNPDALNVSHDPFTYEPNANYDQRLQQRNRQGIQMKQQVENNAARLNPALLGYSDGVNIGAPVVITDSNNVDTVINGNGRAMAIIRAMQTNPENIKAYHEYLIKHAYDYGWTPEQVTQYIAEHPKAILVRQVNEDDNMIQEIAGATGGGMSLSAAEQAARDVSKVPEYVWQKYQPNEKGEIDNTSNHEFVDGVLKNITNQNEINEFMPDINGDLSVPGAMRVRNALFAYAYGDKRLISDVANFAGGDSMTSQVVNGLTRAAGDVAKARAAMKSNGKEELNFIPKLVEAARTVRQFGRDEQALEKEINSISMFSEEDAGRNIMALDDETKRVLAVLFANKGSGANIGKFIKGMANAVIRTAEVETDVFGADDLPKTIMDVIEEGAKVGGIKQTDLGKKEGAENGYNARTRGNTEEGNSQEQSSEIGERGEGESGEGAPATTSTADTGRTTATTGEVTESTVFADIFADKTEGNKTLVYQFEDANGKTGTAVIGIQKYNDKSYQVSSLDIAYDDKNYPDTLDLPFTQEGTGVRFVETPGSFSKDANIQKMLDFNINSTFDDDNGEHKPAKLKFIGAFDSNKEARKIAASNMRSRINDKGVNTNAQTTEQLAEQLENKPKDLVSLSNEVEATAKEGEKAAETEEEKKVNSILNGEEQSVTFGLPGVPKLHRNKNGAIVFGGNLYYDDKTNIDAIKGQPFVYPVINLKRDVAEALAEGRKEKERLDEQKRQEEIKKQAKADEVKTYHGFLDDKKPFERSRIIKTLSREETRRINRKNVTKTRKEFAEYAIQNHIQYRISKDSGDWLFNDTDSATETEHQYYNYLSDKLIAYFETHDAKQGITDDEIRELVYGKVAQPKSQEAPRITGTNTKQLAEVVDTGKLSQESELENLAEGVDKAEKIEKKTADGNYYSYTKEDVEKLQKQFPKEVEKLAKALYLPGIMNEEYMPALKDLAADILAQQQKLLRLYDFSQDTDGVTTLMNVLTDAINSNKDGIYGPYQRRFKPYLDNGKDMFDFLANKPFMLLAETPLLVEKDGHKSTDDDFIDFAFNEGGIVNEDKIKNLSMSELQVIDDIFNGKHPNITPATKVEKESEENGDKGRIASENSSSGVGHGKHGQSVGDSDGGKNSNNNQSLEEGQPRGGKADGAERDAEGRSDLPVYGQGGENTKPDSSGPVVVGDKGTSEQLSETVSGRPNSPVDGASHVNQNYHVDDVNALMGGSHNARWERNKSAIKAIKSIISEGRDATEEEKAAMAGFTGWGGFSNELRDDAEIKSLLNEDDLRKAMGASQNAYYTNPAIVQAMWQVAEKMGFKGGRVLEPSMGVGNFFALMPKQIMENSSLTGIEFDNITGMMAQSLYPNANIQIKGYEDSKTSDNFYDLVIGNPPFGSKAPFDRRYSTIPKLSFQDYFFLKAVDQVRPGGLVMFVTENNTMDGSASRVRAELAKKCEFITAVRLPTGAFRDYAGTDVVTDIVVLKKREKPIGNEAYKEEWVGTNEKVIEGDKRYSLNRFFDAHKDHVLGKMSFALGGRYNTPIVKVAKQSDEEYAKQLASVKDFVEDNIYTQQNNTKHIDYIANHTKGRHNSFVINSDDNVYLVDGEHLKPITQIKGYDVKDKKNKEKRFAMAKEYSQIGDTYSKLQDADSNGLDTAPELRKQLNELFDKYVKQYGSIHDSWVVVERAKNHDPNAPLVMALETKDKDGNYVKAKILNQPIVRGIANKGNLTIDEAFTAIRNKSMDIDFEEISKLTNASADEIKKTLIDKNAVIKTPNGNYVPMDIYLSGNVRIKLREAQDALDRGDKDMESNIEQLKAVVPKTKPYYDIPVSMGAGWIRESDYVDFVREFANIPSDTEVKVSYSPQRGWKVYINNAMVEYGDLSRTLWAGRTRERLSDFIEKVMNQSAIALRMQDPDNPKSTIIDKEATEKANAKADELRDKFESWIWTSQERKITLEENYNEMLNATATPIYDGSFLTFTGMSLTRGEDQFDLRKHQINAVYKGLVNGCGLYAHEVGTGKTYVMGALAIESKRYGMCKKTLLVAHNANAEGVAKDIQEEYPGSKILSIPSDTEGKEMSVLLRQIQADDWDVVVIPESKLPFLSFKKETALQLFAKELQELEDVIWENAGNVSREEIQSFADAMVERSKLPKEEKDTIQADNPISKGYDQESKTARELMNEYVKLRINIEKWAAQSSVENAVPFEETGIDMLVVDEAHLYKKPPLITKIDVKGINKSSSGAGASMTLLTRYIHSLNNGKGVHMFTGTPITNTLPEIYNMFRYVAPNAMKEAGVYDFDRWYNTFAESSTEVEISGAGEWVPVTRLSRFKANVGELRRIMGPYLDVVYASDMPEFTPRMTESGKTMADKDLTADEEEELLNGMVADDKRVLGLPYEKVIDVECPMTQSQQRQAKIIMDNAKKWKEATGKQRADWKKERSPLVPIVNDNKATGIAIDARFYDPELPYEEGSKETQVLNKVLHHYEESSKSTQIIFLNGLGYSEESERTVGVDSDGKSIKAKVKTFALAKDIKRRLIDSGIPEREIVIINDVKKKKRQEVFDAVDRGEVRVIIGGEDTLGTGVNMQTYVRAMHFINPPWTPAGYEQMKARGVRQGNRWNTCLVYRYISEPLDGKRWGTILRKWTFITQFLKATENTAALVASDDIAEEGGDVTANDLQEAYAKAVGDPRVLQRATLEAKVKKLSKREHLFLEGLREVKNKLIPDKEKWIEIYKERVEKYKDDISTLKKTDGQDFKIVLTSSVLGKDNHNVAYTKRSDADEAFSKLYTQILFGPYRSKNSPAYLGEFRGFGLFGYNDSGERGLIIRGKADYDAIGKVASIEAVLRSNNKAKSAPERGLENALKWIKNEENELVVLNNQLGATFSQADELEISKTRLDALNQDLLENPTPAPKWLIRKAPEGTTVYYNGDEVFVNGHKANKEGYYVEVSKNTNGENSIVPYQSITDEFGVPIYDVEKYGMSPEYRRVNGYMQENTKKSHDGEYVIDITTNLSNEKVGNAKGKIENIAYKHDGVINADATEVTFRSKTDEIKFFTEATKYLYTVIPDAIQRSESIEETHATILANDEYTSGRVFNDVVNEAKEAFKGADIVPNKDNKTFTIKFKNGQNVTLDIVDEIIATPEDMERYKAAHGKLPKAIKAVTKTKLTKAGLQAIVQVSTKNSQYGDLFHESFHIAAKLFLSGKQYNSLMDYFDKTRGSSQATPEELAADGYKAWRKAREERRGTLWGKLYQKVLDGCNAVLGLFNTKKRLVNNIFKQMESGELFNGKVNTETKDSIAFTGTDEEKNTALNSVVATPQRTGWKGAFDKGGVKAALDYLFTDFYTKMVDKYYAFEKFDDATKARKAERIIDKVHMLNANTEGNTNALIQGDATDIKVLEKKLNINLHDVTLKNVLSVINPKELDKLYPDYLKEQNKEGLTWIGAFDNYLVWRRLLEMAQHHDQAYIAEYKEWMKKVNDFKYWQENDGADATRPEAAGAEPKYKPYVLPKVLQDAGITEADLKNKIKAAPAEFERAANLFYQWNDNILSVLEQGGVIDGKLHNLLNTKYKNYCSLMRDFSDENSIEDFVAGLTNGGKGIGNVKQMIKRISLEGSERAVLSPLEVAVKSCAIAVNRAERNKVAQFAVKKLLDNGFGILEEAKGETRPNPLKSIFTVMENGKTVAYKCNSPELYQAITMMDANVANSLTDALSTFAKTLRWGATISPSFTIRNGIRDTVQAFVVGEDGFIPVIDTIVGIYKYYNNPEFKAEIDAAGIAMFNQFGKSSTTKNTVNNANKGMTLRDFVGASFGLEYISSAIEKGTRAGLYNNARKSGKSMDEAQLSAVRGTLNFSRSGSIGQQVNKIDAFFNATIQGLDQLFRVVGGGMKATYNVASGGSKLPPPPPPNASQRDIDDYNSRKEVRAENLMKMKRLARILFGLVIPSIMLYLWNSDEDWYEDLDPGIKYTNWIFPNRVMLPMPHEYGVFAGFTMATLDYMKKHDRKAYEHWRKTAANSLAINILPTAVTPILENATNYSFFAGKPLENQNMVRNLKPGERYSGSTSEVAKSAGQYFNVSPIKIDNLVRGYTGTTGTFVMKDFGNLFYELTGLASTKPYKPMSEKTFIRDFNVTDYKLRRYTEEFMNMAEEARQNKDKYKKYLVGDGGINKLNEKINELFRLNRDIDLGKKYPKHSPEFKKQLKDKNLAEIRRLSKLGVERFGDKIDY